MNPFRGSFLAALAVTGSAYAQQPPDVVTSDAYSNTAMGTNALSNLAVGGQLGAYGNTASGSDALALNTFGHSNSASGADALQSNTTGSDDTAIGVRALALNTTGWDNTASGIGALEFNTTGSYNTASGMGALDFNTIGAYNTASGAYALNLNKTGIGNVASGYEAMYINTNGSYNIAMGFQAGSWITGSNNIDIGNAGVSGESNTIRIGRPGTHKVTVIAGIYGTPVAGSPVYVSSTGRLGMVVSSERFKTAIAPMGSNTAKLQQLRPVTFRLKSDPKGTLQYGLIAEEVANVYPELVIRNESGRIDGVRYDELAPMLLNELEQQAAVIRELKQQMTELKDLKQELHAALIKLQAKGKEELVAQR